MNWATLFFGFGGRIRRRDYWIGSIAAGVGFVLALLAFGVVLGVFSDERTSTTGFSDALTATGVLAFVGVLILYLWVNAAVGVKRCHDRNYSGWMYLAMFLVAAFIPFGFLWQLIDLGILEGVPGPNRWGASPKGEAAADAFA